MRILTRIDPAGAITLVVAGTINGTCIADFKRALGAARRLRQPIHLDLSEVTLVDRPSLQYLVDLARGEVVLVGCPEYIARWMDREDGSSRASVRQGTENGI
jgi:anti-anti-sigma regulatory factor